MNGVPANVMPAAGTNYALPEVLTPNGNSNLATSISYAGSFAVTSVTGPNGATGSTTYDQYGRPSGATATDGATTGYGYTYNPNTQTASLGNRWKKTTLDGFGRVVKLETGHDGVTVSVVETQYAACACSPLGKVWRVSQPHGVQGQPRHHDFQLGTSTVVRSRRTGEDSEKASGCALSDGVSCTTIRNNGVVPPSSCSTQEIVTSPWTPSMYADALAWSAVAGGSKFLRTGTISWRFN